MEIDTHYWEDTDRTVHLALLFEYLHFTLEEQSETYLRYSKSNQQYIVIHTDSGYWYYRIEAPQEKLRASDLISAVCTTITTSDKSSLWEKITRKYEEFLVVMENQTSSLSLAIVPIDYNHFTQLTKPFITDTVDSLYHKVLQDPVLAAGITMDATGAIVFPIYNNKNILCGYLQETSQGIRPYLYTNTTVGVWRSGIPEKVNEILMFSDPKEAIAFYVQYQPQHAVCMACSSITYATHRIISRFKKVLNAKKIICGFTGGAIEGYLKDLNFIAYQYHCAVDMEDTDVLFTLKQPDDALFSKFYKKIQEYNNNISVYFKKYNKTRSINRRLILKHSIVPKRTTADTIVCRIPLETDALKFMVWAYQKFFFTTEMKIIKPSEISWIRAYAKNDTNQKPLESYTIFKIAM